MIEVGVVLEQLWHSVPGGTASSALRASSALMARPDIAIRGISAFHRSLPEPAFLPTVPMQQIPMPRRALYESWHRSRTPAIERFVPGVDVVWATGYAIPAQSVPLIATVHDLAWRHNPGNFTPRGVKFFEQALRLVDDEAELVHAPSLATARDLRAAGIGQERIVVIAWGVETTVVDRARVNQVRRGWHLPQEYILSVGTIEPRKNLPALIEAWKSLGPESPDLVIVGPSGWNDTLGEISADLADRVHLLGFVSSNDLRALYRGASLFCYPAIREGFGLPVLESLAQGTPVVTTSATSMEELVTKAGAVLECAELCQSDSSSIADAIQRLLDRTVDPGDRERIATGARDHAGSYTWDNFSSAFVRQLERVVG